MSVWHEHNIQSQVGFKWRNKEKEKPKQIFGYIHINHTNSDGIVPTLALILYRMKVVSSSVKSVMSDYRIITQ